jgi:hypothetical protein
MKMTSFQREGLQRLGYTKRESEFLFLVATHSGYFTTRQFRSFAGTDSGSVSHAFIQKLLTERHASYHAYRSGGRVYHLFARKVYQAIDRENLRTRKRHQLEYVKTRLVALDFVLAHLNHQYLEIEQDKCEYFVTQCRVARETLPVKLYRARRSSEVTPRYFVDRFPMLVGSGAADVRVTFTFIDAEAVTLSAFETHLRAYLPLFRSLPHFEFVYVAPTSRLFVPAREEFWNVVGGTSGSENPIPLVDYFRLRKAWDLKERVASADVVALKKAAAHYAGQTFDDLYKEWCSGAIKDDGIAVVPEPKTNTGLPKFRTELSGSSLCVFNAGSRTNAENRVDRLPTTCTSQFSDGFSVEESRRC